MILFEGESIKYESTSNSTAKTLLNKRSNVKYITRLVDSSGKILVSSESGKRVDSLKLCYLIFELRTTKYIVRVKGFLSILFVLTLLVSHGQNNAPLCFEYVSYDAGTLYSNDKSFVQFPFSNCTSDTLIIEYLVYRGERGMNVFNVPYGARMDTIVPFEKDTLKFYKKTSSSMKHGYNEDIFGIRFIGSSTVQELKIYSNIVKNNGRLGANPVQVPTVTRGEKVIFTPRIKNYGTDPVTIRIAQHHWKTLKRIDNIESPVTIQPGQELVLTYELQTKELLRTYSGVLYFETNEEGRYPRLNIEYYGELISENHPSIKFDSLLLHKYVDQYGDGNFEFWFENDGDAPLLIEYAKTSCGCMVASHTRDPIAPGERNVIKVKYDTKRIGPINKSITVKTNVGEMRVMLRVKGMVYRKEE